MQTLILRLIFSCQFIIFWGRLYKNVVNQLQFTLTTQLILLMLTIFNVNQDLTTQRVVKSQLRVLYNRPLAYIQFKLTLLVILYNLGLDHFCHYCYSNCQTGHGRGLTVLYILYCIVYWFICISFYCIIYVCNCIMYIIISYIILSYCIVILQFLKNILGGCNIIKHFLSLILSINLVTNLFNCVGCEDRWCG